jgi:hypothetical protein
VWRFYDNSDPAGPRLIASGVRQSATVADEATWRRIEQGVQNEAGEPG